MNTKLLWKSSVLVVLFVAGAQMQRAFHQKALAQRQTAKKKAQATIDYKKGFVVRPLPAGWNQDYGLHALAPAPELRGTLCWVGNRNSEQGATLPSPVVQRVALQATRSTQATQAPSVRNFALAPYNPNDVDFVGQPAFDGDANDLFFRISRGDKEFGYPYYNLGHLSLKSLAATIDPKREFQYAYQFLPSPQGGAYAIEDAYPYNGANYSVDANVGGKRQELASGGDSEGFSWTKDGHVLYSDYPPNGKTAEFGYPFIYENDLQGHTKLVKKGGFRPTLNADKTWLSYVGPDTSLPKAEQTAENLRFSPLRWIQEGNLALHAYDTTRHKAHFVMRICEHHPHVFWPYPHVFWVGDRLYILENLYIYSKQVGQCRLSVFNGRTRKTKLLGTLEQKGTASLAAPVGFRPNFDFVGVAGTKSVLLQVPVKSEGADNYHLLAVSLQNGTRSDLFSFTANKAIGVLSVPNVAWIEPK